MGILLWAALAAGAWPMVGAVAATPPLPRAEPAAVDMSATRLRELDGFLDRATTRTPGSGGGYLGGVVLVARDGQLVAWEARGSRDLARQSPMQPDSIFRMYSMTKTVTSVAVLMLLEEGRLGLEDPVSDHLPEFAGLQVMGADGTLRAPKSPITIRELLTHTAGFATGGSADGEAGRRLEAADLHGAGDLAGFVQRLARVPLAVDPGTRFQYDGSNTEVLARLVEVLSGEPFDSYLATHVFGPLQMRDTGFEVPAAQRHRIVDLTRMGDDGQLRLDDSRSAQEPGVRLNAYPSGAGGLYSTGADYLRFAEALLEGGTLHEAGKPPVRVLSYKTVELMMQNHLTMLDPPEMRTGEGFGLGGSVLLDVAARGKLGSVGQFGWSGAASTYYTIDPREHLVAILLLQHLHGDSGRDLPKLAPRFWNVVYQALEP